LDAASSVENPGWRPREGDFSVCIRCGQILRFDQAMEPVIVLEREVAELDHRTRNLLLRASRLAPRIYVEHRKDGGRS
jgi:hypothetical protein